jgi:hypothetical protein
MRWRAGQKLPGRVSDPERRPALRPHSLPGDEALFGQMDFSFGEALHHHVVDHIVVARWRWQ